MPDQASINRSLNTIRTELEYLQQSGAVAPAQFQSIMAQLPILDITRTVVLTQHHEWAKKMATKFGNAAVFGAGATFGGDLVNDVMRKF
ncbi:hypothetical protein BCON_0014g00260 [Botryotinia convoluta]|uniref:Uncharacterized protein n=1 Tax=Botryotinia convoluta TaxID=54673 RepID=A0A4Z1J301_9HELO|nr:hypothetical protein BCON_0014g00260 [Botryotinia convoluta]